MKIETLQTRRENLASEMEKNSMLIINSGNAPVKSADQYYEFSVWRNFFYLTNIDMPNMAYVMKKTDDEITHYLFIDQVSELEEKWSGYRMKKDIASQISGIDEKNIHPIQDLKKTIGTWMTNHNLENAYFDLERNTYNHPDTTQTELAREIQTKYPHLNLTNAQPFLTQMRLIKSDCEIQNLKTAVGKTKLGIERMLQEAKPGMKEYELEAYFDFVTKQAGVKGRAFGTIAAAGTNATVLHYHDNDTIINDGELILFDLGCSWNNYNADISRTFPINGKFSSRQKEIYQAVLDVQKEVINKIKPGIKLSELNEIAKKSLASKCKILGLIDKDEDLQKYYYHGIGHFLGLDTHDVGGRDRELKAGMVITIEPGLYIEEESIGIRIEDDILVTETGFENLSADIIKEIDDIESSMNQN